MADLTGTTPADTYKSLLQIGDATNGVDATAKYIEDGEGTDSALAISTTAVGINTTNPECNLSVVSDTDPAKIGIHGYGSFSDGTVASQLKFLGKDSDDNNRNLAHIQVREHEHTLGSGSMEFVTRIEGIEAARMTIDEGGNIGIDTDSPDAKLEISGGGTGVWLKTNNITNRPSSTMAGQNYINLTNQLPTDENSFEIGPGYINLNRDDDAPINQLSFGMNGTLGAAIEVGGGTPSTPNNQHSLRFKVGRDNTDNKAGIERMRIDSDGNVTPGTDDAQDIGSSSKRWDDIYATNTTIQTSDRELKQDIEELTEAEERVAVACKGLLRKYRWKSSVAEKGDDARIHFGIMAQDLEAAFAAEGLDAGRYGMFIKNTWWEADRVIPAVEAVEAVEAVYDEEGNEVSPAVEAVEAQPERTERDIFDNVEDAPEGATEVTQRGVRYAELLAFIIAAI